MARYKPHIARICYVCGTDKTLITKSGHPQWHTNRPTDLFICDKCHHKYFYNPEYRILMHKLSGPKRILFRNRRIYLDKVIRTGVCKWCGYIGLTHLHHTQYHDHDILKDTVELCPSCHAKESNRLGQTNIKISLPSRRRF